MFAGMVVWWCRHGGVAFRVPVEPVHRSSRDGSGRVAEGVREVSDRGRSRRWRLRERALAWISLARPQGGGEGLRKPLVSQSVFVNCGKPARPSSQTAGKGLRLGEGGVFATPPKASSKSRKPVVRKRGSQPTS
jgi:hypothetical protein